MPVENISIVEVRQGPVGPAGTNGSDATVTAANTLTALQAMTTAQETASRDAIAAQSSVVGFLDRFDRYTDGTEITHLVSAPLVGTAYRVNIDGGAAKPVIENGYLRGGGDLFYLGIEAPTVNNKMSLLVECSIFESNTPNALSDRGINLSFAPFEMITDAGGIIPTGTVHITFSRSGIASLEIYLGQAVIQVPRTRGLHWVSSAAVIPYNQRFQIRYDFDGDAGELAITAFGETILFRDPLLEAKIGPLMRAWYEADWNSGSDKSNWVLHRIAMNAPELDQSPNWGSMGALGRSSEMALGGPANLPDKLRAFNGQSAFPTITPANKDGVSGVGDMLTNATFAKGTLFLGAIPTAAQTVTCGGKTYTWRASVASTANEVLIGASVSACINNLVAAINLAAGSGTLYGSSTTVNANVTAAAGGSGTFLTATYNNFGELGNSSATTETMGATSFWTAATLEGGYNGHFMWRPFSSSSAFPANHTLWSLATSVASGAGDSNTTRLSVPAYVWTEPGYIERSEIVFFFAANAANKTIRVHWLGGEQFTTGAIAENGSVGKLTIWRHVETTISHRLYFEWESPLLTKRGYVNFNAGNSYSTFNIQVTTTSAADLTINSGFGTVIPPL